MISNWQLSILWSIKDSSVIREKLLTSWPPLCMIFSCGIIRALKLQRFWENPKFHPPISDWTSLFLKEKKTKIYIHLKLKKCFIIWIFDAVVGIFGNRIQIYMYLFLYSPSAYENVQLLDIKCTTRCWSNFESQGNTYPLIWSKIPCTQGNTYPLDLKFPVPYTIIDLWWGLLMTMKTASGIGWLTPKVNQYLTRSSWSWVDRNQKSIIALLNYREFSITKIEITIVIAFYRACQVKSRA